MKCAQLNPRAHSRRDRAPNSLAIVAFCINIAYMAEGDSQQAVTPIPYASRLPCAGRDAGYPEIIHYAKMLRFGGLLLVVAGWVGGVLSIFLGSLVIGRGDSASGVIFIISAVIAIILLNALAALLAMIAFVGLAVRDLALHRE